MLILLFLGVIGCATGNPSRRIINGVPLNPGEMPFLGILDTHSADHWYHVCGAALLTPNKAITSAHCITAEVQNMRLVMGEHNINVNEGTEQYLPVQSFVVHPDYDGNVGGYPNDLAVLTLAVNADLNSSAIATIPLGARGADYTGSSCTILGWGSIHPGTVLRQEVPAKATFPVISNTVCSNLWSVITNAHIYPSHVCMYSASEEACHYDYGGPMVCNNALAGIISWGDIMCDRRLPSVMASVSYYHDWILQHL